MTHEEYQRAAEYWVKKDVGNKKLPDTLLRAAVEAYITLNNTCALATGLDEFVRCTPIEYSFHKGAFWMFSEGGQKFIGLEMNKNVCIAIYEKYDGFGKLKGMQVSGIAEMIKPFSQEYVQAAEYKKIPIEALKKLSSPMYLIKVVPVTIDFLNSDFKEQGYASRQQLKW